MNKTLATVLFGMLVVLPLAAEEVAEPPRSPEAIEILEKVDASIKKVSAVRYKVSTKPGGAAENFFAAGEGSAALVGWTGQVPRKFLIEAHTSQDGQSVQITGGGNGDMYFLIDHASKTAFEDMDPAVLGWAANTLFSFAVLEFVHSAPFDDELGADRVELQGTETVGGEECYKIHVVYAGGQGESTWYFSKDDYLPRRRVQSFDMGPQGEGSLERTIYDLEVNPAIEDVLFVMKLPEGYEQIDDFAPAAMVGGGN